MGRAEGDVLDDLDVLAGGQPAGDLRRGEQPDRQQRRAPEHPAAHGVPDDLAGDGGDGAHDG